MVFSQQDSIQGLPQPVQMRLVVTGMLLGKSE
jgi:hypothetical protein